MAQPQSFDAWHEQMEQHRVQRLLEIQAIRERSRAFAGALRLVVCELCLRGEHLRCVRPCTCREGHKTPILSEGGENVGLTKHGAGEILPDPEDSQKTATQNWTPADEAALAKENADADDDEG